MHISEHTEWLTFKKKGVLNHNKRRAGVLYYSEWSLTVQKQLAYISRIEQYNKDKLLLRVFVLYVLVTFGKWPSILRFDSQCLFYFKGKQLLQIMTFVWYFFFCNMICSCLYRLWGIANGIRICFKLSSIFCFSQQQMVSCGDHTREIHQNEAMKVSLSIKNN